MKQEFELEFEEKPFIPEKKLIAAILKQAWNDLCIEDANIHIRLDTIKWIKRKDTDDIPWSFEWCCDHLNFPSNRLRSLMLLNPEWGIRRKNYSPDL